MALDNEDRPTPLVSSIKLQDVAAHCGVSVMTVSRALRNDPRVRDATKARVVAAAQKLGYDPQLNAAARRLVMRRHGRRDINHLIALLVPKNFHNTGYFPLILKGILDILEGKGYGALTCYTPTDLKVSDLPAPFSRDEIDGIILPDSFRVEKGVIDIMRARPSFQSKPIISLVNPFPGASLIGLDGYSGGYQLGNHLLALGHRHSIHYYKRQGYEQMQRLSGVRQAFVDYGLDPDVYLHSALVYEDAAMPMDVSNEETMGTTRNALQANPQATAIIARNDRHALGIMTILTDLGLRVPDDISLVGYDDIDPIFDALGRNLLTTIRVPLLELGRQGAARLVQMIEHSASDPGKANLPVELVVRHTTAPVRAST